MSLQTHLGVYASLKLLVFLHPQVDNENLGCPIRMLLALPYSQTDEYLKYYQRTVIQQLMETEAETCIRTLD